MNLEKVIDRYHQACDEFSRGDPQPVKLVFSRGNDVTLANPFGPPVRGWKQVSDALDFASSRFRDGEVISFERICGVCDRRPSNDSRGRAVEGRGGRPGEHRAVRSASYEHFSA
jgi:hypothetical protein